MYGDSKRTWECSCVPIERSWSTKSRASCLRAFVSLLGYLLMFTLPSRPVAAARASSSSLLFQELRSTCAWRR